MALTINLDHAALEEALRTLEHNFAQAQDAMTVACKEAADPFTPTASGDLRRKFTYTRGENGARNGWVYTVPYAASQHRGTAKDGSFFNFSTDKNPKACRLWTLRGVVASRAKIMAAVTTVLKGTP